MTLDVAFSPHDLAPGDVAGRPVFVIDILRAVTTMCAAIHSGARAIVPAPSAEEAMKLAQTLGRDDTVLAGEQNCLPIPGFALGNSPLEMTTEAVGGRIVVMRTTNGTRALLATQGAGEVHPIAASNLTVATARARALLEAHGALLVLCGGRENTFSIDDSYCAGRLLSALLDGRPPAGLNDAARAALDLVERYGDDWVTPLRASRAGRQLLELGFENDIAAAADVDRYPVLLRYQDRRVTRAEAA